MRTPRHDLSRRRLLFGGAAVSAGVLLAGCTSNEQNPTEAQTKAAGSGANTETGKKVSIGFSAPAADHGWIAAITNNAKAQAGAYQDVELKSVEAGADAAAQRAALSTLISQKPDVIVLLPHDGKELNAFGLEAMKAGIPVVNLDRAFPDARAYRLQIKGDNYGMGVAAATYIAEQLKAKGVSNPVIGEIPGIESLELTQERSKGFADTLASYGFKVANRRPAEFTVDSGQQAATGLFQALPKIDAVWNHDDDQGIGVLAAVNQANRKEFVMVGGAGSKKAMEDIAADNTVLKATVTYSPSMASSAISLARLIGQGKGMSDLVELQVPKEIVLASETITKENASDYLKLGF
ncbi:substrate-binding domain-containing protein [Micromonospora aurantiaca]|uniref:Substrate-binding domain-containing protein n=1 Tax=Micromonospora aurantiaca (nom. illeg.) TaxID=47850 RepID=A0A1C6TLG6_9ACTN|nr:MULTISPECIES: substrate-binding domain-containing protein [Micromonospora]ADL48296.1 periplasmic binding protein/LacI transcriptional regulator [Micromonospora aurantiaca ATCC 27029]ADU09026.1 periplasmic binding protein/LacI transcriptional regulator [Micromonospora sp. L5]AXH88485.1 sugar ABC transporter substrate-binding protein [Micromonospora aurantiaca]KAB1117227.1 substrate-binding domain-containing protein [Micromonospora aurantiaca]MDG4753591.1 substrate-binding domain-containing p